MKMTALKNTMNTLLATATVAMAGGYFVAGGQTSSAASFLFNAPVPAWETSLAETGNLTMAQQIVMDAKNRADTVRVLAHNEAMGAGKLAQLAAK